MMQWMYIPIRRKQQIKRHLTAACVIVTIVMGDAPKLEADLPPETNIEKCSTIVILNPDNRQPPPPYYQPQPPPQSGGYPYPYQSYYPTQPSYPQQQQRVGGQNVYVASGGYPTEPPNVSRGQPAYVANYPGRQEESAAYRNSEIFENSFNTIAIRNRFVQRVYTILSVQLFFSFGFILLVTFIEGLRELFKHYTLPILIVSALVYLVTSIALLCCGDIRRQFPLNFILLAILTVALTLMTSCLVAVMTPLVVLCAMGTTAGLCLLISIFACQTKWDVTGCGMCLYIAMIALMLYGLVIMVLRLCGFNLPILHVIYSALGLLLFSFWLMYDTQQIMGGRSIELSPEEYITGALQLYIDIMYIFKHLLVLYNSCLGGD